MAKYGPSRNELWFRIGVSILGLSFMGYAVWFRGVPDGPALVEVVGIGTLFFGGTLVVSVRRLWRMGRA